VSSPVYRRILLKLSGESLGGRAGAMLERNALNSRADDIRAARDLGVEIGIVPGGGNIIRGAQTDLDRATGDRMGMLATAINALALADVLETMNVPVFIQSAFPVGAFLPAFSASQSKALLSAGHVGIFPGGTGNPYFTTDTAAALRALELEADVLLKGTRVDGVYSDDPERSADATRYHQISFDAVLKQGLTFMDLTATTVCRDNDLPIIVFNQEVPGSLKRVLLGEPEGTLVTGETESSAKGVSNHD
jgi:uridylate kinase